MIQHHCKKASGRLEMLLREVPRLFFIKLSAAVYLILEP